MAELSDATYTHNDFLTLCNNQEELARLCFDSVDWQHPETWLEEQSIYGEWIECAGCKKFYDAVENTVCPYCGAQNDEDAE